MDSSDTAPPRYGRPMREIAAIDAAQFAAEILPAARPVVLRGVAADWPAVRAADPAAYLAQLDAGVPGDLLEAPATARRRFFYDAGLTGFNFTRTPATVSDVLDRLALAARADEPPALALQAIQADVALPGFSRDNPAPLLADAPPPRLWIGNRVVVAAHHDLFRNLAVVVAGRRRFTLFPPAAVGSLYLGPLEFSPAGTPISLVDATAPDLDRFPAFAGAMAVAEVAELAPGDAIYIPYLWWHQVESLDPLSILANYWWSETPPPLPGLAPIDVLTHARLAFSAASPEQRAAWRAMIDHLVFDDTRTVDHLPPDRRGILGPIGDRARDMLRRRLGAVLSR